MQQRPTYSLPQRVAIARQFQIPGDIYMVSPYGGGHINDTFQVETKVAASAASPAKSTYVTRRFLLQRINTVVFKHPEQVMQNIQLVLETLHTAIRSAGGDPLRESLTLVNATDGKSFWKKIDDNTWWRCYHFIELARTYDFIAATDEGMRIAYQAAYAFGMFQKHLIALPGTKLFETIENFHHTPSRIEQLKLAIKTNVNNRLSECPEELAFAARRYAEGGTLVRLLSSGLLPGRVCLNDTKINNVLFDFSGAYETARVVIDLDTVMPGTPAYDFGDLVRTAACPAAEDEQDLSKVTLSLELFEQLVKGFAQAIGSVLTKAEKENLLWGGKIITYNMGIRFLADYLRGDTYYRISYPDQNLVRCKTQFKLVEEMEKNWDALNSILKGYLF
jgi:hypothetical protein